MKKLLLLPLLFGLVSPAIAHNEANGGCGNHCVKALGWNSNPGVNSNLANKQKEIINLENSQPLLIDNQVNDLSEKINAETKNSTVIYIVIGILITIIPLVTWRYFTK